MKFAITLIWHSYKYGHICDAGGRVDFARWKFKPKSAKAHLFILIRLQISSTPFSNLVWIKSDLKIWSTLIFINSDLIKSDLNQVWLENWIKSDLKIWIESESNPSWRFSSPCSDPGASQIWSNLIWNQIKSEYLIKSDLKNWIE